MKCIDCDEEIPIEDQKSDELCLRCRRKHWNAKIKFLQNVGKRDNDRQDIESRLLLPRY